MGNLFPNRPVDPSTRMHSDGVGEYWFYHKETFPHDEPLLYANLISSATSMIEIWDPHFNVDRLSGDPDLFTSVQADTTIKLLTMQGLNRQNPYLTNVLNAFKVVIPASKNVKFGLRVIDRGNGSLADWAFHDRFLIVDGNDTYLIGGSVGWHRKPNGSTGILKLANADTVRFIRSLFDEYWKKAAGAEIPLGALHP